MKASFQIKEIYSAIGSKHVVPYRTDIILLNFINLFLALMGLHAVWAFL